MTETVTCPVCKGPMSAALEVHSNCRPKRTAGIPDLSDPLIREMAIRNHIPREIWNYASELVMVVCFQCGGSWPCPARIELRERDEHD